MNLLTENIRWVQSLTLEGDRVSADEIIVRRDMLAGARIDSFGVRPTFIITASLFLANFIFSVSAFLETMQFFQPNYTVFALSLLPMIGLGLAAYKLRPRKHFTVLLRDGSAIGLLSRDGNFLTRCLEAFERLWADPRRAQASLYLHIQHRSVDFGPPPGGLDVLANEAPGKSPALTLPVFAEADEDSRERVDNAGEDELETLIPRQSAEAQLDERNTLDDTLTLPPPPPPDDINDASGEVEDNEAGQDAAADEPPLPPLPPPLPSDELPPVPKPMDPDDDLIVPIADEGEGEDGVADEEATEPEHEPDADPEPEVEPEPAEVLEPPQSVDAQAFLVVRPKVEALVRLLRERAPAQGISDAVDVLELMTRRGCKNEREVRALARSVEVLRERMHAYPTAVELMDDVAKAGRLPRSQDS